MKLRIPLRLLNIEGDGYHLQAKIRINGKSALVIVDTGASRTVFDKTEIQKYLKSEELGEHDKLSTGLGTSSMTSQFVILGSLTIGKLKIPDFDAVILDLQHVNQTYSMIGLPSIAGVLGSDVLVGMRAVIDFSKKEMVLHPKTAAPKKKTKTPKKKPRTLKRRKK